MLTIRESTESVVDFYLQPSILNKMHSFEDALHSFIDAYPGITTVVDVGVQGKTDPLIKVFPKARHLLFEPVVQYHNEIRQNYKDLDYVLIGKAVSNRPATLYQHLLSRDCSANVTHSQLREESFAIPSEKEFLLDIIQTDVTTLSDEIPKHISLKGEEELLVKIDIDGKDSDVMEGMFDISSCTALLIVECPVDKIIERSQIAACQGFEIFDITSPAYYFNQLSQVDIFFVNSSLKRRILSLNPWQFAGAQLVWSEWKHYS